MRVVVFQPTLPPYRRKFFELLRQHVDVRLLIGAGPLYEPTLLSPAEDDIQVDERFRQSAYFGKRVVWRHGLARRLIAEPVGVVLPLNPRDVSALVTLVVRRIAGRHTLVWGHRNGRDGRRGWGRRLHESLATGTIYYTQEELRIASQQRASAATNALYTNAEIVGFRPRQGKNFKIVSSGRVVAEKDPFILVELASRLRDDLGENFDEVRFTVLGDGPLLDELKYKVGEEKLEAAFQFPGAVWEKAELERHYSDASVLFANGYAGLNVVQALSHGVRCLALSTDPHAPEVSYISDLDQGALVPNTDAAVAYLRRLFFSKPSVVDRTNLVLHAARELSLEAMVAGWLELVLGAEA